MLRVVSETGHIPSFAVEGDTSTGDSLPVIFCLIVGGGGISELGNGLSCISPDVDCRCCVDLNSETL